MENRLFDYWWDEELLFLLEDDAITSLSYNDCNLELVIRNTLFLSDGEEIVVASGQKWKKDVPDE